MLAEPKFYQHYFYCQYRSRLRTSSITAWRCRRMGCQFEPYLWQNICLILKLTSKSHNTPLLADLFIVYSFITNFVCVTGSNYYICVQKLNANRQLSVIIFSPSSQQSVDCFEFLTLDPPHQIYKSPKSCLISVSSDCFLQN